MKKILILGAYSAIAQETARCFAKEGGRFFLVGRDGEKLNILAQDLKLRGAHSAEVLSANLDDTARHAAVLNQADQALGGMDAVLIAYGTLADQKRCQADFAAAEKEIKTNFLSPVSFLILLADYFEEKKKGVIAVITSVAGDRGRGSNYTYGTAKGALSLYLQGLRARLVKSGVRVVTVKPGFVETPMTAGLKKKILVASPETVGRGIYQAMLKPREVVYLPWFWRPIMGVIKIIPEAIFKKMKL